MTQALQIPSVSGGWCTFLLATISRIAAKCSIEHFRTDLKARELWQNGVMSLSLCGKNGNCLGNSETESSWIYCYCITESDAEFSSLASGIVAYLVYDTASSNYQDADICLLDVRLFRLTLGLLLKSRYPSCSHFWRIFLAFRFLNTTPGNIDASA